MHHAQVPQDRYHLEEMTTWSRSDYMEKSRRTKQKKSPLKNFISRAFTIVCLAVFIYSAYSLVNIFMGYHKNRQVLADAQEIYYDFSDVEIAEEEICRR